MWSLGPMSSSLTQTQLRNLFSLWVVGNNASSKVKEEIRWSDCVMGSGVRWGPWEPKNLILTFFFLTDWDVTVLSKYFSHFSLQFSLQFGEIVFWRGRRENLWAPPLFSPPLPLNQTGILHIKLVQWPVKIHRQGYKNTDNIDFCYKCECLHVVNSISLSVPIGN